MPTEGAGEPGNGEGAIADVAGPGSVDGRHLLLVGAGPGLGLAWDWPWHVASRWAATG
ncbi:MAG: hypothetical protein WBH47_00735 [Streptosporangiaceae bacterium]